MNKNTSSPLSWRFQAGSTADPDVFFNSNYDHVLGTSLALKFGIEPRHRRPRPARHAGRSRQRGP
jgi:hypothetical protein